MSARYLLDTDICIFIRRRHLPQVQARFEQLAPDEAVMSLITYGELLYGVEKHINRAAALKTLEELVTLIAVTPMGPQVAREYAILRAVLEKSGSIIGNNDLWIAAHARAAGLILVTNNEREFKRVPKLKVENWAV
jgi:tRNA(fMet)-specific endonuclease VapC